MDGLTVGVLVAGESIGVAVGCKEAADGIDEGLPVDTGSKNGLDVGVLVDIIGEAVSGTETGAYETIIFDSANGKQQKG